MDHTFTSPDELRRQFEQQSKSLLYTLEQGRDKFELSKGEWASTYLRITEEDYEDILAGKQDLSAVALLNFTEKLWINTEDLQRGSIDFESVLQRQKGVRDYIHPRYMLAAKSHKHAAINSLAFVEKVRGFPLKIAVNRHFQISDDYWAKGLMDPINARFMMDLMKFLRSRGLSDDEFRDMGMNSYSILRGTVVGKELSAARSLPELYEKLFYETMVHLEGNCRYRVLKMSENMCVMESVSNMEVANALETAHTGNQETCLIRTGMLMVAPYFLGSRPASVHETHCVHRGDPSCRVVIDFSMQRIRDNGARLTRVV